MKKMLTLLRAPSYSLAVTLVLCLPFPMPAQVMASAKTSDLQHQTETDTRRSLREVLNDMQTRYGISFVYEDEVIADKTVTETIKYLSRLEPTMSAVLEPLGLRFKKINDRTYAISRQKKRNVSSDNASSSRDAEDSVLSLKGQQVEATAQISAIVPYIFKVNGVVFDENNQPLPGANVLVKGTALGTTTDADGAYNVEVPDAQSTLVFSFIGYQTLEIKVDNRSEVNVVLQPDVRYLDEVAVIGYGTVKKSDLTGSVAQVKAEELNSFPTTNVIQALSGRAPGVYVIQNTGAPGAGVNVRIRGTNSVQGGNEPLYVIDGFPFSGNPTNLNSSEIESIEVLKDASATAIYGSRGANGVVLITTKQGKAGQTKVDFETSYSIQSLRKKLDLMNGSEYARLANIQAANENKAPYFTQEEIDAFGEGFDWQDLVFQDAPMLNSSLTVSGGNEKTTFSLGGVVFQQDGIIRGSDYNRYSFRTNINHKMSEKFSVNLSSSMTHLATDRRDSGGGARGNTLIGSAISAAPISTPYNDDGTYRVLANEYPFIGPDIRNPLNFINEQFTTTAANVLLANAAFMYKPIPELTIKISGGVENRDDRTDNYTTRNFINSDGSASVSTGQFRSLLNENTISYEKSIGEKHRISAIAGFTYQDFLSTSLGGSGVGFLSDAFGTYDLGAAETPGIPSSSYSKSVLLSYLGRVNYSFNDRYLLTASFRTDGSSKYSEGKKWGYFPSLAAAWRVVEEEFLKTSNTVSDLKVRASWGMSGSQAIGPYVTLNQLRSGKTIFGNELHSTFAPGTQLPGDLQWETTEQFDAGVDLGVLNNRLYLTADYYVKNTRDLLNTVRLPSSLGFTTTVQNVGEVQNSGVEFGLDAKISTGDFKWDVYGNFSVNRNKVISLYNGEDVLGAFVSVIVLQDNVTILREGRPIGQFYGYREDGYTDEGKIKYHDTNGDGAITAADKTYIGDPNPDFIYGINSAMSYKNFEFTFFLQGTQGNDIFNVSAVPSTLDYGRGLNMPKEVLYDHWTPENTDAKYPVISQNSSALASDRMIEDGSYLRLRNVQLAYNVPVKTLGIDWLRNGQLYVSGQNLITLTKYSWWDPEVSSRGAGTDQGIDHYTYPVSKVVTMGVRLGF